jgi:hypothetical protein
MLHQIFVEHKQDPKMNTRKQFKRTKKHERERNGRTVAGRQSIYYREQQDADPNTSALFKMYI